MKWSKDNSILLSKICIFLFAGASVAAVFLFPAVLDGIVRRRGLTVENGRVYAMASFYSLLAPAVTALCFLYRMLKNISRGDIFSGENVQCLRILSWSCFLAAVICLISAAYYLPFGFLAAMTGFMGLILRVVKNVFAEAVALKQENDYTI